MANSPDYTRSQLARLLRVSPRRLGAWQRAGLLPAGPRYGWQDLLRGRKLRQWSESHLPAARLRALIAAARERCPELGEEALDAPWDMDGARVALRLGGQSMEVLTGQFRLPFEPAMSSVVTVPLPASRAQAQALEAENCFAQGLSLEGQPAEREAAAAAYQRCLELDPGFGSAWINLGTLRYHQRDFAAAEECYRRALALDPDYALAHFNLGNVLDETGRMEEAITAYGAAVRLAPGYADAHYNLALALQRQGQHRRAIPHWRQYLGLDNGSPWAAHARDQLKKTLAHDVLKIVPGA